MIKRKKRSTRQVANYNAYSYDEGRQRWNQNFLFSNGKSIDRAQDYETRKRLRERSREEIMNNAWAYGAGQTLVSSVVGSGGRLQLIPDDNSKKNDRLCQEIERDWQDWFDEVNLGEKLRAMRFSKFQDGETFAILFGNNELRSDVKFDLMPIDCDRVTSRGVVQGELESDKYLDGIELNQYGNAVSYRVLKFHPGGFDQVNNKAFVFPASDVIHWYKRTTAEQHRGVPEITPALTLFNSMRRYTDATVIAAETAADISFVMTTDEVDGNSLMETEGEDENTTTENDGVQEFRVSTGRGLVLPEGFDLKQLDAKQPTQNFGELIDQLLGQIGSCIGLPRLIMRKSAMGFNYAGARVDLQSYYKFVAQEQNELTNKVLKPIFYRWLHEYCLVYGLKALPVNVRPFFYYDGQEPIDPQKEASATATKLSNKLTTLSEEYAKRGLDWENALTQRAKELALIKELERTYGVDFDDVK